MIIFVVVYKAFSLRKKLVLNISIFWLSAAMMIWLSFFRSFSFTSLPPLDLAKIMIMQMQVSSFSFTSLPPQDQARKEGSCRFQSDAGQVAWWRFLNGDGDYYHTDITQITSKSWPWTGQSPSWCNSQTSRSLGWCSPGCSSSTWCSSACSSWWRCPLKCSSQR